MFSAARVGGNAAFSTSRTEEAEKARMDSGGSAVAHTSLPDCLEFGAIGARLSSIDVGANGVARTSSTEETQNTRTGYRGSGGTMSSSLDLLAFEGQTA